MRKTRILVECYEHQPSFELNIQGYGKFSKVAPIEVRGKLTKDIKPEDIEWCDILVDVRGGNPLSAYVVKQAKKAGRKAYLSLDDDLMEIYSESYEERVFRYSLLSVIKNVDYMLTSSQYLGDKYQKKYGIKYAVINTVVEREQFKINSESNGDGVIKLVYAAGSKHIPFFDAMIKPILNRLYEKYSEKLSLTIIGPNIDTMGIKLKINKNASMPFDEYRRFMDSHHFDIGLAPLFDTEFCRSKYFNKYLEYSTNNICGIYSNVMPYTLVVEDGVNGLLTENNPKAWYDAICKLVDNRSFINVLRNNAKEDVLNNFSLDSIVAKVNKDVPDLFSYKANSYHKKCCRFMKHRFLYYAFKRRILSCIYKRLFSFKTIS